MSNSLSISINAGDCDRFDITATVDLSPYTLPDTLRMVEVDASGSEIDAAVAFQIDRVGDTRQLTLLVKGHTTARTQRQFRIFPGEEPHSYAPFIRFTDNVMHEKQDSYRIETPTATYFYHKQGAGFASMIDVDGNDWLRHRPFGGSAGKFRGIPNLVHPENYFHPGAEGCTSEIIYSGPLTARIASRSLNDKWACTWDFYPTHARMTVLKVGHPYWFLYEGVPGGALDEVGDYCVRSDGVRLPLREAWDMPLPAPEWVAFGASNTPHALFLVHHEADDHMDSYWPMEGNMTVFGFGRSGLEKFMTETPAHFSIGFAESGAFDVARRAVESALHPLAVTITSA